MYCFFCEKRHPGGTSYGINTAHGICKNCGVAVCVEHGLKGSQPGAPLLCVECTKLLVTTDAEPISIRKQPEARLNLA